ncbi:sugar kinase [Microbacterium sp.]|uniref:sugar kinase n=1 Tax=Microbacterium sp. TaxID=51671 RepID=UPI003A93DF5B
MSASSDRVIDVVTVGESLGLVVSESVGRLVHSPAMRLGFGGAESNVAIGVSRLGQSAAWAGRVGADGVGELIVRELRAEGVQVHAQTDAAATALMIKERPRAGESRVTYYRSVQAGSHLVPGDVPEGLVESARILHVTGITPALGAGPLSTVRSAIARAKDAGVLVSFDVNHRSSLWESTSSASDIYRSLVAEADIVFAGLDEGEIVTGLSSAQEQATALRELGATCAVIKLGADGAYAVDASGALSRPAVPVDVVDTVGAGDAFVAGWLSETVRGSSLAVRLQTATACGAFACTAHGDWEATPTRAELAGFTGPRREPVQR